MLSILQNEHGVHAIMYTNRALKKQWPSWRTKWEINKGKKRCFGISFCFLLRLF